MVIDTYKPSSQEAKKGGSQVWKYLRLQSARPSGTVSSLFYPENILHIPSKKEEERNKQDFLAQLQCESVFKTELTLRVGLTI